MEAWWQGLSTEARAVNTKNQGPSTSELRIEGLRARVRAGTPRANDQRRDGMMRWVQNQCRGSVGVITGQRAHDGRRARVVAVATSGW